MKLVVVVVILVLVVLAASAAPRRHDRRKRARLHKLYITEYTTLTEHDAVSHLAKLPTAFPTARPSSLRPTSQFPTARPVSSKPTPPPTQFPTKRATKEPTLKKSKKPTSTPTVKPSKQPSAFPTRKPTTAFPTKLRTTMQPTWEEGYSTILTEPPSIKPLDSSEGSKPILTSIPTAVPTTMYPTQTPSVAPTTTYPTQCSHLQSAYECSTKRSICEWYSVTTTNYLQFPPQTNTYEYGCQERATFCEFTQGPLLDQQMACNQKNFPCTWSRQKNLCMTSFRAPTPPPMPHEECYNICLAFADNGRCDDGGPGSHTNLCMLGTDCGDCGPRWIS